MQTPALHVAGGVATVFAVLLAILVPMVLVGIAGGVVALILATKPKLLTAIAVLGSMFVAPLTRLTGVGALDYLDDALIVLLLVSVVMQSLSTKRPLRGLPGLGWFLVFAVAAALGALVHQVELFLAATDAFLLLKGVIAAFAIAQLDWTQCDLAKAARVGGAVIVLSLTGAAVNFVMPGAWNAMFGSSSEFNQRGGIPTLISFYGHPGSLAQIMAVSAIALFTYRQVVKKSPVTLVLLVATTFTAFATFRRKTAVGLVIALVAMSFWKQKVITTVALLLVTPLLLILFGDSLVGVVEAAYSEYFGNVSEAARVVLYQGAATVANDNFPLGVGFAQYGGFVAATNYSPVYYELGFPNVWGLQPGGRFMTDTFWPAIVGEAGWIGGAAYAIGIIVLTIKGFRLAKAENDPHTRWIGILALALSIEFALESVAAPVYSSPPSFLILFGVFGVCASLNAQKKQSTPLAVMKRSSRTLPRLNATVRTR